MKCGKHTARLLKKTISSVKISKNGKGALHMIKKIDSKREKTARPMGNPYDKKDEQRAFADDKVGV